MPRVSVLMPVYNGEKFLREAIESILNQTYTDFEFIIVDDGSTDSSHDILEEYAAKDNRIKIITNERNCGICITLNRGLDTAAGEYIVRMDCDDISLPQRIERQVEFMDTNLEIGVVGCAVEIFSDGIETQNKISIVDTDPNVCAANMLFAVPVAHPATIIRKSVLEDNNLRYDDYFRGMEDYHLWWRISRVSKISNVPELLFKYRKHPSQVTKNQVNEDFIRRQREFMEKRVIEYRASLTDSELNAYERYIVDHGSFNDETLRDFTNGLSKIVKSQKSCPQKERNAHRLVSSKAITYAYDCSSKTITHSAFYYERKALRKGCMSYVWLMKRIGSRLKNRIGIK